MTRGAELLTSLNSKFSKIRGRIIPDAPMCQITWLRVGGLADILFQPIDVEDLSEFLRAIPAEISLMVVGTGSNILVRDGGIEGIVIRLLTKEFGKISALNRTRLKAGAAISCKKLAATALTCGLDGFAFYHGIPGSLGGALRMNAGAHDCETAERVVEVHALDRHGDHHVLGREDMDYGYRSCGAAENLIFIGAILEGEVVEKADIRRQMDCVHDHRKTVQPIREKTGGSTFKNPPGHSAWKLIDSAGMRGVKIGGAQMSPMHCNFMINTGGATAYELETLGEQVRRRVLKNSGIELQWEIKRMGRFEDGKTFNSIHQDCSGDESS